MTGCPGAPNRELAAARRAEVQAVRSEPAGRLERETAVDAGDIPPVVSWGTRPDQSLEITAAVPGPEDMPAERRDDAIRAMAYMDLAPHTPLQDIAIDRAFIGSCTNARLTEIGRASCWGRGCQYV